MQASAKLTNFIKNVSAQYHHAWWEDRSCLRLVMPDVEPYLQIENLGNERISIGLYLDFEGRYMPELEIVLWSGFQPQPFDVNAEPPWAPIEYASVYDTWQLCVELNTSGAVVSCFDPAGQSKLTMMANDWGDELNRQGWLGENVWLSRCTDCHNEQAIWERDLSTDDFAGSEETAPIYWLTMSDFEEDLWPVHEVVTGSHYIAGFNDEDEYSFIPIGSNNGSYEHDKASV